MSSFGFNRPTATDFRHPSHGLGFGTTPDPFVNISQNRVSGPGDDDAIDFDDTYDGLGDDLEEADDDFNDDTFGGEQTSEPVGKDFDFYGSTSQVTSAINQEAVRYNRQQAASKTPSTQPNEPSPAAKPFKTGYEAYKNPAHIPELQVDASLWGTTSSSSLNENELQQARQGGNATGSHRQSSVAGPAKKMMSLEEVEAAMRAQPRRPSPAPPQYEAQPPPSFATPQVQDQGSRAAALPPRQVHLPQRQSIHLQQHHSGHTPVLQRLSQPEMIFPRRKAQHTSHHASQASQVDQNIQQLPPTASPASQAPQAMVAPQVLQRGQNPSYQALNTQESEQPRQILQNPNRSSGQFASRQPDAPAPTQLQHRGQLPSQNGAHMPLPVIYHPSQIMNLTEEERNAYLVEEAKRAKRNHKIFLLSKGNGLMTPQDKNFITRIQLQQLMTATGNVNEHDPDASLSEDFYYQVYNQIESRPRQNPQQPLSNFAQTYLFRTGGRPGVIGRRQRGGDSHMQRMEQQVQRAVEAAKAKPKNKQLVIEGSLGKISFSNAKTPKPLLSIKRNDSSDISNRAGGKKPPSSPFRTAGRKEILTNIEAVYSTLMKMEDHDRRLPPTLTDEVDPAAVQAIEDWQQTFHDLNGRLWIDLRVTDFIIPDLDVLHPFIAFLSYPKGKKAIPRIFNHVNEEQRLIMLTRIMVHLDVVDVIQMAQPQPGVAQPSLMVREQIDLFLQAVMPSLFSFVTEAPLHVVVGLSGLVLNRNAINAVIRTRVGLEVWTMFLSRAAILKAIETSDDETWNQWSEIYDHFFDLAEPLLGEIFPTSVNVGQDQYVWQFLAATGSAANEEQQQRLVLAVKDRVMDTLQQSKTLPPEMASQRRGNVNLFMQAIGLDVDLLDG